VGKFVDRFEDELATYTGAKYAISVVNGTAALQIALKLAGVKANDEVLVPALTFVATVNAITYCNAIPHFVDSEEGTLGIDTSKLRDYLQKNTSQQSGKCVNNLSGRIVRALVPMHTFGHPSDIDGLLSIANDFNIVLVEDAAESLGSFYHGQHTGTFGLFGTLSFNGNKTITTGGGGAILTNNEALARHAKHLTTTAKIPHAWEFRHDEIGYNYRMPNINAALICAQLEQFERFLENKRELASIYSTFFEDDTIFRTELTNTKANYWLNCIEFENLAKRNSFLEEANHHGIMCRPIWKLAFLLSMYKECQRDNQKNAIKLADTIVNIPSSYRPTR
jgi:aminotransferase in exopolysaccharide biosynthesis